MLRAAALAATLAGPGCQRTLPAVPAGQARCRAALQLLNPPVPFPGPSRGGNQQAPRAPPMAVTCTMNPSGLALGWRRAVVQAAAKLMEAQLLAPLQGVAEPWTARAAVMRRRRMAVRPVPA